MEEIFIIREALPKDFSALLPLLRQLWPNKQINEKAVREIFLDQLKKPEHYLTLVAEQERKIVGLITLSWRLNIYSEGFLACIDELVVEEKYRGKAIGKNLVEAVSGFCKKEKIRGVYLTSAFHRKEAHLFYEKNGFEKASYKFEKYF